MFRVCGVIWTYNPDLHIFEQVIKSALSNVDFLLVMDNGSSNREQIKKLLGTYNIVGIFLPKNLGVAALDIAFKILTKHSCEWILILDDDSIITDPNVTRKVLALYDTLPLFIKQKIGVISLSDLESIPITLKNKLIYTPYSTFVVHHEATIFSGALVKVDSIKNNKIDKELFLYHADVDLFNRLRKTGFITIIYTKPVLKHRLGIPLTRPINLGFYKITSTTTPHRFYYITRNATYLLLRGRLSPLQFLLSIFRYLIPLSITHPLGVIKALALGIVHGAFGMLGIWETSLLRA